jgi:response regulator RpfG family c-di-GMP phosphodiesterase
MMAGMRGTILIVDDEPEILTALRDQLEDEFDVWSAVSPLTALEILADEPSISVIVSDQRMPEMTGDVMLARAREISDAQTILLTGYADLGAVVNAINQGRISAYAQKPWEPALLMSMVANAHEQCELRRALRQEQALLRGLMDASQDALSFKDAMGRFVRLNHAKAAALGRPVEACLRHREQELVASPEDEPRIAEADAAGAVGGARQRSGRPFGASDPGADRRAGWAACLSGRSGA